MDYLCLKLEMEIMRHIKLVLLAFIAFIGTMSASADIPPRPNNANDLIYDYAGIIESRYYNEIRDSLRSIYFSNEEAGTQVVVLTVKSLDGVSIEEYAHEVLVSWGIGSEKSNNGLLILVKPKTGENSNEKGLVRIETGYGLEGALPDILCRKLETDSMIPEFEKNNYGLGILKSVKAVVPIVKGEYPPECEAFLNSCQEDDDEPLSTSSIIICVVVYLLIFVPVWFFFFFPNTDDWYSIAQSPLLKLQTEAKKLKKTSEVAHGVADNKTDNATVKKDDEIAGEIAGDVASLVVSSAVGIAFSSLLGTDIGFGGGSGGGGGSSGSW